MKGNYKRPAVVFNMNNPMHRELYEWCTDQSTNFSDFVRTLLFLYMKNNLNVSLAEANTKVKLESKQPEIRKGSQAVSSTKGILDKGEAINSRMGDMGNKKRSVNNSDAEKVKSMF